MVVFLILSVRFISQQPIPHLRGDVDVVRRAGSRRRFTLQSLVDVHIYVPKHRANNMGGRIDGLEVTHMTLNRCGTAR